MQRAKVDISVLSGAVEARVHRALGDPSRVRILEVLRAEQDPIDTSAIAARVGLHPNTVRSHLRILEEAQLVASKAEERTRPGRPRIVYGATPEGVSHEERAGYRLLAEILASYLAGIDNESEGRAEQAGHAWGRYLVGPRRPFSSSSAEEDVRAVVSLLEQTGFEPTLEPGDGGDTVLMQRCPFGEVAGHYRDVVCSVHLGLIQGALAELGAHVAAHSLQPFVEPGVCAARLEHLAGNAQTLLTSS